LVDTENYAEPLVDLQQTLKDNTGLDASFKEVRAGNSHALLLDSEGQIYAYGLGVFGQLGSQMDICRYPLPVDDINEVMDPVTIIACGPNYNICYTQSGILYYWGMLVPDDV
jgi:alpha-tubulin suppressor-like RCC1 family protein